MIRVLFFALLVLAGVVALGDPRRRAAAEPPSAPAAFTAPLDARLAALADALRRPWVAYAAVGALAACGALHAGLVDAGALLQRPLPAWLRAAPIVPIVETLQVAPHHTLAPRWLSPAMELLAVFESLLVAALWASADAVRDRRRFAAVAAAAFAVLCAVFVTARGTASSDMLAYVGDARLGTACYAGATTFRGPFALVSAFWGAPMIPCAYGPMWIGFVHAIAGALPSLAASIVALRLLALAALLACAEACRRLAIPRRCLLAVFLDPAVHAQFLGDGHNDLEMVALVLWARVLALGGRPWLGALLGGLAGGSKAVFLAVAPLAFVRAGGVRKRRAAAAASVALGLAISAIFGGHAYVAAIVFTGRMYARGIPAIGRPILDGVLVLTAYAVAVAVWTGRVRANAAFGFVACAAFTYPWYLAWGLPYALLAPETAFGYVAALPVLAYLVSSSYAPSAFFTPLAVAATAAAAWVLVAAVRRAAFRRGLA